MADYVLPEKVFNYICNSGGFVELSVLLTHPSPLGSTKSNLEGRKWLTEQRNAPFVVIGNGDIEGVRIQLKKKICIQYVDTNSCRYPQGKCKFWHICKGFIEGHCTGHSCGRSHDFLDVENREKTKMLGMDKYSNSTITKIVGWSLPQVCQLYLKGECNLDKCFYLHVCSKEVQGALCACSLSHNLIDNHNKNILKQFDLVPHPSMPIEIVRSNVLVPIGPQYLAKGRKFPKENLNDLAKPVETWGAKIPESNCHETISPQNWTPNILESVTSTGIEQQRLSESSSCSVEGAKASTIKKKAVFDCILKEYNGSVSIDTISKRQDLFPAGCEVVLGWFKAREDSFLLRQEKDKVFEVSVFFSKARLCFNPVCSKQDCQYFHVCRAFIAGYCRFGATCTRNHTFRHDEERQFISKLKLSGFTQEELRKLLQLSMPQVCLKYNDAACTDVNCGRVHICKDFVRKACSDLDCELMHEDTFMQPDTASTLKRYNLKFTGGNANFILKMLLICDHVASQNHGKSKIIPVPLKRVAGAISVPSNEPLEINVFEVLCKEYQCSVPFSVISKRTDIFPHEMKNIDKWFRKRKGSFWISESDRGVILQVTAYSSKVRLCLSHNKSYHGECETKNCSYLHVCKEYITDSCSYGATCPKSHHFQDERNKELLSEVNLNALTDEELRNLVLSSTPQVCAEYNNGKCDRGDACNRIHICNKYLRSEGCSEGSKCDLKHDSAMHTLHTKAILERYQLEDLNRDTVKRIVLVYNDSTKSKDTGHIHDDKPDAPICSDFLLSKCKKSFKCQGHHCPLPFHWQYNILGEWTSFMHGDNVQLEKLYCDVSLEQCEVTDVQIALEREYPLSAVEGCDASILLDNKILLIENDFHAVATLRRLSTVSYVFGPDNITATQWIWYWKDEHDIWRKYDVDHAGRNLQQAVEEAFLSKRHGFRFRIADQDYRLSFVPESDMSQTNVKYGTTRNVRRRPEKFVSRDDIQVMKRSKTMLPAKQQRQKKTRTLQLPSHWSSMSSETQYKRVPLSSLSDEFKEVEKLFRKSIKKSVEILRIERVQNSFMWEKYQRKKENMSAERKAPINEKQLFHGTSPNAVEAICKQNFDWRLHGKNATKYGEGSYFALNSSYSDSYASQDDNSSQFMFVAKVLVGSYTKGESSYRRPPAKNPSNPASDLYDCCVDNTGSPSIFVVFDTDQFYPEYIIEYCAFRQTSYSGYPGVYQQQPAKPTPAPWKVNKASSAPLQTQRSQTHTTAHASSKISSNPVSSSAYGPRTSAQFGSVGYSNASYPISANTASSVAASYSSAVSRVASSPYSSSTSNAVYSLRPSPSNLPTWNTSHYSSSSYSGTSPHTASTSRRSSSTAYSDQYPSNSSNASRSHSTYGKEKKPKCSVM